jgi:hypothetical protein
MEKQRHTGRRAAALILAMFVAGAVSLYAQAPEGLSISGAVHTGIQFTTYDVDGLNPVTAYPAFNHYVYDLYPSDFLNLNGRYEGANYGAQFSLGFNPADPGFAAPPSDGIAINNAFVWAYALDRKLYVRAGKMEEYNWSNMNVWSPNYRRLSWAVGYTVIEGLTVNVYGDIPNSTILDRYTPEAYAKNIDVGVYYTSAPFDFFLVFDDYGTYRSGDTAADHTDVFFQFALKSVQNLTFSVESKFQNLNDFDLFSNITGIQLGYKISDALSNLTYIYLGNGDFTTFFGMGATPINKDMAFTMAIIPTMSYILNDALTLAFTMDFSVPTVDEFGKFNMYFMPWVQWNIAPGLFFPAAYIQFRYRLDVYNDDRPTGAKTRNDGALAHNINVELSFSF